MNNSNGQPPQSAGAPTYVLSPEAASQFAEPEGPDIRHYFWIVRRRLWMAIGLPLLSLAVTFFFTMGRPPVYKATTRLLIGQESAQGAIGDKEGDLIGWGKEERYLQTQYTLLQGGPLALGVIEQLDLVNGPEFAAKPKHTTRVWLDRLREWVVSLIPTSTTRAESPASEPARPPARAPRGLVRAFLKRLEVTPVKGTRLVDVSFTGRDPGIAANIVNTLAEVYIKQDLERDIAAMERILGYLREQQAKFQAKVQESEKALLDYKRETDLMVLASREEILKDKLAALNTAHAQARITRIQAESKLNALRGGVPDLEQLVGLGKFTDTAEVATGAREYMRLKQQESRLAELYGPKHEKMVQARAEMKEAKALLEGEVSLAIDKAEASLEAAKKQEESFERVLDEQKKEAIRLEEKMILYNVFKREAETNRQLFDLLLKKAEETSLAGEIREKNIRVISKADAPDGPVPSKRTRYLVIAGVLGLGAAIGLAFLLENLDRSVKGAEDLESYVGVSYLGSIGHADHVPSTAPYVVLSEDGQPNFAENFRTLRTNLMFSARESERRSLVITSSVPKEGKSTIASNLAIAIARSNKRVLLADADMRRPALGRAFDIERKTGLSSFLVGEAAADEIVHDSPIDNLWIIPCGQIPKNQPELLGSDTMAEFIKWAEANYDVVIYDSPPVASVSDSLVLTGMTRTAVFVVRSGNTSKAIVKRSVQQLRDLDVRILGVVMNDLDEKHSGYYHHYYHGYPYYYVQYDSRHEEDDDTTDS